MTTTDTQTNDLIEQVARAIYVCVCGHQGEMYDRWDDEQDDEKGGYRDFARAAVLAVRKHDVKYGPSEAEITMANVANMLTTGHDRASRSAMRASLTEYDRERLRQAEEASDASH